MAVYTEVPQAQAGALLRDLGLGELCAMRACSGGIENTNYFVSTTRDGQTHDYVLTLFERLGFAQLPFYLRLMQHLAGHGIPVPTPHADPSGEVVLHVQGKPAAVVDKLLGASELAPQPTHCAQVGAMLARMHLAGRDFALHQPNLRGLDWWTRTVPEVLPHLQADQARLLQAELTHQQQLAQTQAYQALPRGPIHADLFRDNVMFDQGHLSGFFDFYFAGVDTWVFDLAVCLNDWCIDLPSGCADAARTAALLRAYESVRPLQADERHLLADMLRAAALRFWLSRLWDWHLPRQASLLTPHDPSHFERVLRARLAPGRTA